MNTAILPSVIAAAAILTATSGCSAQESPAPPAIRQAQAAYEAGDYRGALARLQPLDEGPAYLALTDRQRHLVDQLTGSAAFQLGRSHIAHLAFTRASQAKAGGASDWYMRLETAKLDNDFTDAYLAFEHLADRRPDFLPALSDETVSVLERGFGALPNGPATQFRFEQFLADNRWRPSNPLFSPDVIGFHYALHLLDAGKASQAAAVISRFEEPIVVAAVGADRRFDALTAGHPAWTDVAAAQARRLERFRQLAASDSPSLAFRTAGIGQLYEMGRLREALGLSDALFDELKHQGEGPCGDSGDFSHALVQRSYILFALGRTDEAMAAARAMPHQACGELSGSPLVAAKWQVALGRGAEALAVLGRMRTDRLQTEAQMEWASLRACAARQAGDEMTEALSLGLLRDHPYDNAAAQLDALLCVGDLDGAAGYAKAALADPRRSPLILVALQDFLEPEVQTSLQARVATDRKRLRERPDVRAAIDKVGRIGRQPMLAESIY